MKPRTTWLYASAIAMAFAAPSALAQSSPMGDRVPPVARQLPAAMDQPAALGTPAVINSGEIDAGRAALSQAQDARVKRYAQKMVDAHTASNRQMAGWKVDTTAPAALEKKEDGKRTLSMLKQAKGAAFDGAYLRAMVNDHQGALAVLDERLVPSAQDADVASFLRTTRMHVAEHLTEAQQLLSQMTGSGRDSKP